MSFFLNLLPSPPLLGNHILNLISWQRIWGYDTKSTHNKNKYKWDYIRLISYLPNVFDLLPPFWKTNRHAPLPQPTLFEPGENPPTFRDSCPPPVLFHCTPAWYSPYWKTSHYITLQSQKKPSPQWKRQLTVEWGNIFLKSCISKIYAEFISLYSKNQPD